MNKLTQGERNALKWLTEDWAYAIPGNYLRSNAELRIVNRPILKTIRDATLKSLVAKHLVSQESGGIYVITESGREAANKGYYG